MDEKEKNLQNGRSQKRLKLSRPKKSCSVSVLHLNTTVTTPSTTPIPVTQPSCIKKNNICVPTCTDNLTVTAAKRRKRKLIDGQENEEEELKLPHRTLRQPKKRRKDHAIDAIEKDQLQLALAISASLEPHPPPPTKRTSKKVKSSDYDDILPPPLIISTASQKEQVLAARLEVILNPGEKTANKGILTSESSNSILPLKEEAISLAIGTTSFVTMSSDSSTLKTMCTNECIPVMSTSNHDFIQTSTNDSLLVKSSSYMSVCSNAYTPIIESTDESTTPVVTALTCINNSSPMMTTCTSVSTPLITTFTSDSLPGTITPITNKKKLCNAPCITDTEGQQVTSHESPTAIKATTITGITEINESQFSSYKTLWKLSSSGPHEPNDQFQIKSLQEYFFHPPLAIPCSTCTFLPSHSSDPSITVVTSTFSSGNQDTAVHHSTVATGCPSFSSFDRLLNDLSSLLTKGLHSDMFLLVANGEKIPAHAGLLSIRCPAMGKVLSSCTDSELLHIDLSSFSQESVRLFLSFLYTANVPLVNSLSMEVKKELLSLGEIWDVPDLAEQLLQKNIPSLTTPPIHKEKISTSTFTNVNATNGLIVSSLSSPRPSLSVDSPPSSPLLFQSSPMPHYSEYPNDSPILCNNDVPSIWEKGKKEVFSNSHRLSTESCGMAYDIKDKSHDIMAPSHGITKTCQHNELSSLSLLEKSVPFVHAAHHPILEDSTSSCIQRSDFITPCNVGRPDRTVLISVDKITPMPDYKNMATPHLKTACSQYGVRVLPKKKMISVLEQIYEYQHPLVDEKGAIIEESENLKGKKSKESQDDLEMIVRQGIINNKQLYQDILMYKPLELVYIQNSLKTYSGVNVRRDTLMDILDQLCITYTIPRQ